MQEETIKRANDTPFGLAVYAFTENLERALNVADELDAGLIGINSGVPSTPAVPFGDMKQSGPGREGLGEYQEIRFNNIASRETR
jgi:succinate-semialdehyde dehydrogenase/glutarate-semialdehyde dehydrogenase